jgi:hypothetical protein
MKLKIGTVLTIIALLFGAYLYLDKSHASAGEFESFKQRAEKKWTEDEWSAIRKRLWALEEYYGIAEAKIKEEYQELLLEKEKLELKLKGD